MAQAVNEQAVQEAAQYISGLVARARKAQAQIEFATQEQVDEMATRLAWAGVRPDFAQKYVEFCAQETGLGYAPHKYGKLMTKVKGALRDMKGRKSVGVVENDREKGIIKIAKPMGVIGAIIPVTNGEATPFVKAHQLPSRPATPSSWPRTPRARRPTTWPWPRCARCWRSTAGRRTWSSASRTSPWRSPRS